MTGKTCAFFFLLLCASRVLHAQNILKPDSLQVQKPVTELKEVKIKMARQLLERKMDRLVFNVESSMAAIGTDALELIGKIPGIKVTNEKISLVGKGSVNVMIDNRLIQLSASDLSSYLKSIPSDRISKVEVISNPSAKYDAQGNNGLINIVLKKGTGEGLQGSVNLNYSLASHPTISGGSTINYRKDRLTFYTSFNLRKGSMESTEQNEVFYPNQTWNTLNRFRNFRTVPNGQIGVDAQLSETVLAGLSYHSGSTDFHSEERISTNIFNRQQMLDSVLISDAQARIRSSFNSANFFLKKRIDTGGKELVLNADWFKYQDDQERFFNNTTFLGNGQSVNNSFAQYLSASRQDIDLYTLKADADFPCRTFKFSFGGKLSFIKNKSDVSFSKAVNGAYVADPAKTNIFDYTENTQALYVSLNKTIKKWALQIGLRGEYTQTRGISLAQIGPDDSQYFQLFPTAFLTYRLNHQNSFGFSYGRRISRPPYKKLNPFRWYSNPFSYMEGNPFLKPSYHHNFELSNTYAGIFTTALSFSYTSGGYNDVNFTDRESNVQILKPINFMTAYHYQFSNSVSLNPVAWIQSTGQMNLFYSVANSSLAETAAALKGAGIYFSTGNQFYFDEAKTLSGNVDFWCQFGGIDGLQKLKPQSNLNTGVRKLMLNKKLMLAINLTDVLKTDRQRYISMVNGIRQSYNNYYDSRQIKFSIRYIFGNDQIKQQNRKPGNDEERKRSN